MSFEFDNDSMEGIKPVDAETSSSVSFIDMVNQYFHDLGSSQRIGYDLPDSSMGLYAEDGCPHASRYTWMFTKIAMTKYMHLLYYPKLYIKPSYDMSWKTSTIWTHIFPDTYHIFGTYTRKSKSRYAVFANPVLVGHWVRIWLYSQYRVFTQTDKIPDDIFRYRYSTANPILGTEMIGCYLDNPDYLILFLCCIAAYKDEFDRLHDNILPEHKIFAGHHLNSLNKQLNNIVRRSCDICGFTGPAFKSLNEIHKRKDILPVDYCYQVLNAIITKKKKLWTEFNYNKEMKTFVIPEYYYKPNNPISYKTNSMCGI